MRIVFMGTPHFAVPVLDGLVQNGYKVVGVITAPDKPAGRGKKMAQSAIKKYAIDKGLHLLQPPRLKNPKFLADLKALKADLQIVVAFRMLPAVVFEMPPMGTFNLHASLLPQYRGAAPINWAVINGETETGLTTFFIEQKIDTGKIIFTEKTPIKANETAGQLHDRLMEIGAKLVLKTVKAIETGHYPQIEQPTNSELKEAPKIYKDTCHIDWNNNCATLYNFIRGLSPYPAAFTYCDNLKLKIFATEKIIEMHAHQAGKSISDGKTYWHITTKNGYLNLKDVQIQGRKRMDVVAFLRGYRGDLNISQLPNKESV